MNIPKAHAVITQPVPGDQSDTTSSATLMREHRRPTKHYVTAAIKSMSLQVQQGSGSREMHGDMLWYADQCMSDARGSYSPIPATGASDWHLQYRCILFGHVRHGRADACAASAGSRLTAAPEGAMKAMVAGDAPRCAECPVTSIRLRRRTRALLRAFG